MRGGRPAAGRPGRPRGPRRGDRRPRGRRPRPDRRPLVRPGHPPVPRVRRPGDRVARPRSPRRPASWSEAPAGLLDALAEATATAAEDDTRYALSCLALRGAAGSIAATDGRQVLIRGGFAFPWDGDVLVRRSPLFACRELPRDRPGRGRPDRRPTSSSASAPGRSGWRSRTGVRFPDVDRILPGPGSAATRLRLDPGDARFLLDALGRLPGADEANAPATVDLNGRVAVRARAAGEGPATELVLSRSAYTGAAGPVPDQPRVPGPGDPAGLRRGRGRRRRLAAGRAATAGRVFAWQPLSKESAIGPADDVVRIESESRPRRARPRGRAAGERGPP